MADAQASGACGSNVVWVQVPSPAFIIKAVSVHLQLLFFVKGTKNPLSKDKEWIFAIILSDEPWRKPL